MDAINWLLINGANAVLWLWDVLAVFGGGLFAVLHRILNPLLSPVLSLLNPACTWVGDWVFGLLAPLPIAVELTLNSAVIGAVMLAAFKYTSNQVGIGKAKDAIKANLLALKLYKDDLRVTFVAQWRLLCAVGRLQVHMLKPLLIMLVPMLLVLAQMGARYQWRPMLPGERAVIKIKLAKTFPSRDREGADIATLQGAEAPDVRLATDRGVLVEVGPVPGGGEVAWRVRGEEPGRHRLLFTADDQTVEKELVVGTKAGRVSAERVGADWTAQLMNPVERLLPSDSIIQSINVAYPLRDSWFYGADYWVLSFFVISMIAAWILALVFKVRF